MTRTEKKGRPGWKVMGHASAGDLADDDVRDRLVARVDGVHAELPVLPEHVLRAVPASDAAEDDAVQERVPPEAVVPVDAAGRLARDIEPGERLAALHALALRRGLEAAHAVVDHRRDDRHVEGLGGDLGAGELVLVELLAAAGLPRRLVPRLAAGVRRPAPAIGVLLRLHGGLVVL